MATIKLPITTDKDNNFIFLESTNATIKQKLKNLLLTSPGELIMNPAFGIGVRRYLFEFDKILQFSNNEELAVDEQESLQAKITKEITSQCSVFLNEIKISNISVSMKENVLYISIEYKIFDSYPDQLEIQIGL